MYLNVDEVDTAVVNLATTYPAICTLITLPNTTYKMKTCHALRLGAGAAGSRDCVTDHRRAARARMGQLRNPLSASPPISWKRTR